MSLVYNFSFPPPAAGETVTVTNDSGTEVGSGDLGSTVGNDGAITLQIALAEGGYIGTVEGAFGTWSTRGFLDVPSSIEDAPGAAETAYLIATAVAGDTDDGEITVDLEADPAHGELPEWVTIVAGEAVLGDTAGGCFASLIGKVDFDFTATDAPDDPGHSVGVFTLKQDGSQIGNDVVDQAGDGLDAQAAEMEVPVGDFVLGGTISATVNALAFTTAGEGDPVSPAAVTATTLAVNITRVAPAPILP